MKKLALIPAAIAGLALLGSSAFAQTVVVKHHPMMHRHVVVVHHPMMHRHVVVVRHPMMHRHVVIVHHPMMMHRHVVKKVVVTH